MIACIQHGVVLYFFYFFWQYLSLTVLTNCVPLMSSAVKIKLIWRESYITLLYRGKEGGEKWLNFLQVTKFFLDEIFPRFFFTWRRIYPDFSYPELLLLFPIYLQNLLLPFFFWCTLSIFNKNFEIRVKARNWKK